ncbi:MAG TPA: universal stress protein [Gemmatimonadales bacterium]|nr:universal stress protein [Gemmatimonadales bacterium]
MKWRHLVVASDGSGPGMHAVEVATTLGTSRALRITVVTVLDEGKAVPAPLFPYRPVILRGNPGVEIARYADQWRADVVILGRRAIPRGTEFELGPTAESVVRRSSVPCLLIPEGQRDFAHIIVALDGTQRGFIVLDAAEQLHHLVNGGLEVVTVEQPDPAGAAPIPRPRTMRLAEELAFRFRAGDGPLPELQVRAGEPVTVLREELRHPGSDLLVVGAHRGGARGKPLDSTGVGKSLVHSVVSAILTVPL